MRGKVRQSLSLFIMVVILFGILVLSPQEIASQIGKIFQAASSHPCDVCGLLRTGQTTQYSGELDDGYYQKGIVKSYSILTAGQFAGASSIDLPHILNNTNISFDAATNTITQVGAGGGMNVFLAAGNDVIIISGSANNNGAYNTLIAAANTVRIKETFNSSEPAGANVTIAKREAHSNNCVQDNITGLMWSRYVSGKMGILSNGKMPWTGIPYDILQYCRFANVALLGGYGDWRIPNTKELDSITSREIVLGLPDPIVFPGFPSINVWTSTTWPSGIGVNAWNYYFNSQGEPAAASKTNPFVCILVRGG